MFVIWQVKSDGLDLKQPIKPINRNGLIVVKYGATLRD